MKRTISTIVLCALLTLPVTVTTAGRPTENPTDEIRLSTNQLSFTGQGGRQTIKVLKGKNYELFCSGNWISCKKLKNGTLEIDAEPYNYFYPRTANIVLTSKKTNYSRVINVSQMDRAGRPAVIEKQEGADLLYLSDMDLPKATFYYIKGICKNRSADGNAISLKGSVYRNGIGTHAPSTLTFKVNGAKRFIADLGTDDEIIMSNRPSDYGIADYNIFVNGRSVESGRVKPTDNHAVKLDIDLTGAKTFAIRMEPGVTTSGDHISLGNARFIVNGKHPVNISEAEAEVLMKGCTRMPRAKNEQCPGCGPECNNCGKGCASCNACKACKKTCKNCKDGRHRRDAAKTPAKHDKKSRKHGKSKK